MSSLNVPGQGAKPAIHRVTSDDVGYATPVFKGKEEQRAQVQVNVEGKVCSLIHFISVDARRSS
jgi:hypothetical protein